MNISTKPAAAEVEIHGNFVDGREIEAGSGAMLDVRNPASVKICASFSVVSGVYSDGFTTVTHPLASTAASDLHMIIKGWLNGVQLATTPIGVRRV